MGSNIVKLGVNDLASQRPDLVKEWDYEKNDKLPQEYAVCSHKIVWWKCDKGHTWKASVRERVKGNTCLECRYTFDLWCRDNNRLDLLAEWHPNKNGNINPKDILPFTNKKYWWLLSYDDVKTGRHFNFEWNSSPNSRIRGRGCPYLAGVKVWKRV